jgi:fructose-bisphosphate aldolase class II
MPLTHTKDLFAKALKGKYALGAFNVNNMELIQAIVEACEEEKAPLILQTRLSCANSALTKVSPA